MKERSLQLKNLKKFRSKHDYSKYNPKPVKKYGVLFFDNFNTAIDNKENIIQQCQDVDQLNVVIRAEGDMDHPVILAIHEKVKIFAGEAWWTIHERRVEENWYQSQH